MQNYKLFLIYASVCLKKYLFFRYFIFNTLKFTVIHRYSPSFTVIHRHSPLSIVIHRYSLPPCHLSPLEPDWNLIGTSLEPDWNLVDILLSDAPVKTEEFPHVL